MRSGLFFIILLFLSLLGYGQTCTLTVSPTSSAATVCSGNSVIISANAASGTAPYVYSWSTGETTPTITVNKAGTYTVTVTDANAGCQAEGSVSITSTTTPQAPSANDVAVCVNTPATLTATAPGGVYQWYDASGNFLFTGQTYTTGPISVKSVFYVEATVGGCTGPRKAVTVHVYGPPEAKSATTCEGTGATLTATPGYNSYNWYDVPTGVAALASTQTFNTGPLASTTTFYVSGVVNGCVTGRTPVTVFITQAPKPPVATDAVICSGTKAELHANAPTGIIEWFDVPTGGIPLISSADFTTPALTANKVYYVQVSTGCVSTRTVVNVTVNQLPDAPVAATVAQVCPGTSAHLTATATAGVVEWFTRPSGGTAVFTGNAYDTPVLTREATYYIQANNSGCISKRTAVKVTLTDPPVAPSASPALICPGTTATLTATAPGGTYEWFTVATGGTAIFTGDTFTTPALTANTTYYVQTTAATGCISKRTAVGVSLLPVTPAPTAPAVTICNGSAATLTASGANNYQWYDAATGGTKLFDGQAFVTPALSATTTYYLQTTSPNGCLSARNAVTVTVNPIPSAPTINPPAPVCTNSPAVINANPVAGVTISWFKAANGGTALATGNNFTTPPVTNPTTYYAEASNGTCKSTRTPVTVTLITGINPQFQYAYRTVCTNSGTIKPVINNPAGGTFSASPAGLVFISTTTGEINIDASVPGLYTISFANNGACPGVTTARFGIGVTTNAQFSYSGPFCQGGANPSPVYPGSYSAGTFSASPGGLVFTDASSGEIDLDKSAPGTYDVTNTIASGGSCSISSYTTSVVIFEKVIVDAGPPQSVQAGTPVQLVGSITGGSTSGTWSGGAGSFSNASSPTAIYTPAAGESSATLTLTSGDPSGPCGPVSASVTISFTPVPAAPTAAGDVICMGNSVTLSATAPGGDYKWYDAATGGTLLARGPSYTTPVLTATTTYYVSTTVNDATGPRTAVKVTVNPPPPAPTVATPPPICSGATVTLTVANPGTDTYEWYSAAVGGNLVFSGAAFPTGSLTASTSYYVQAVSKGCTGPRTPVTVTVNPVPTVISADETACSGVPLNYPIISDTDGATFTWSRAAYPGNPAVTNQTTSTITETLVNTGSTAIDVTYTITAIINGCSGPVANVVVTVYPAANVTSPPALTICNASSSNYAITFDAPATLTWSRQAVPGISNATVSGQSARVIREVLFNTTNAPVKVNYDLTYLSGICTKTFTVEVTVNPPINITSALGADACNSIPQPYTIVSNVPSATFKWSRNKITGISNPPVSNQSGAVISEALVNTTNAMIGVDYTIIPSAFGCDGAPFYYRATVYPTPVKPAANSNTPVCSNSTILLNTDPLTNAVFMWTGPNGFSSSDQNPQIPATAAAAGRYFLTVVVNGCSSPQAFTDVEVNEPPVAVAGDDALVCIGDAAIQLAGNVHGGTTTGVWSSSGNGTFSPAANHLDAQYIFSAQDKAAGSVVLTLMSTSKDDCAVSVSSRKITFGLTPAAEAGPDQEVCVQTAAVPVTAKILAGTTGKWTTSGTGSFNQAASQPGNLYMPSAADIDAGKVTLKFTVSDAGPCFFPADSLVLKLIAPPKLNAGGIRYVLVGHTITLRPTVSDENVTYLWSPAIGLSDPKVKNPVLTGDIDRVYTLTVTDSRGCVSTDNTTVKISPDLAINNTFTPNGDGINDVWNIVGLIAYEDAVIDVFNRNGAKVFHSVGYGVPWDGTTNGGPVPVGVYYYMIDTKLNGVKLSGWVTVIR